MAPMTRTRARERGVPVALNADYYAQRADAGLIITEDTHASPIGQRHRGRPVEAAPRRGWRMLTSHPARLALLTIFGTVLAAATITASASAAASPAAAFEQSLLAGDGAANDRLGHSVAIDGDTAAVGAPGEDSGRGAVYLFTRTGDSWTQTAKLTASDGAAGDQLGLSVAIEGDAIVAGAPDDDFGGTTSLGSAYTFARTGPAARTETAKLAASDGAAGDQLGGSLAIEGDAIVAGAPADDVGANADQGSVYTFARTGPAARTETAKLAASDGAAGDLLGVTLSIEGDAIVAGAPFDNVNGNSFQGSVYTFARTGPAARTETAKLTASDGAVVDRLGSSVAIDGDTIVAGAPADTVGANTYQGSAYTFARTGPAARAETAKLTAFEGAPDDMLGRSVAVEGDAILAGAPLDDVGANANQGSAVFLEPTQPAPTPTPTPTAPPSTQTTPPAVPTTSTPVQSFAGVKLVTRRLTDARRIITVRLSCPAGTVGRCSGRTKLTARRRASSRRVTLGRASFSIAAGARAKVRVRVSRAGRR